MVPGPTPDNVVEGHIVFTTIQPARIPGEKGELAAAVAILVRERTFYEASFRFPGVLWFNDQYLTDPNVVKTEGDELRHPCTGAVLAVNRGEMDPRALVNASLLNAASYNESYSIMDPNNKPWLIDKWNVSRALADAATGQDTASVPGATENVTIWSVPLQGASAFSTVPDNGECDRDPYRDGARSRTGDNGFGYPCGGNGGPSCRKGASYNAVLFFYLRDLHVIGAAKNHTAGSTDRANDVSGCHENGSPQFEHRWPCPGGNDEREGNSHAYNPEPVGVRNLERNSHGLSADCTGDGVVDHDCHTTRQVDVYYWTAPNWVPKNVVLVDTSGSDAPFHCHQDPSEEVCEPPFDDGGLL